MARAPKIIVVNKKNFLDLRLSEITPNVGESTANKNPDVAKTHPRRSVVTVAGMSPLQYFLKKIGKNPAMTVVKKTLLAKSYKAQDTIFLFKRDLAMPKFCQGFKPKVSNK